MKRIPLPRALLLGVVALALVEWVAAARSYRDAIGEDDWRQLAEAVAAIPPHEAVRIADDWLTPRVAMKVPRLARLDQLGAPDLREPARLHVIGFDGRAWSDALQAELEDRGAPERIESRRLGALTLTTWQWPAAALPTASFVDQVLQLQVSEDGHRCKGQRTFKCSEGRVTEEVVEVDYRPRRCLRADVGEGSTVAIRYPKMRLGTVLRGHVGFSDFNRRLRSDAPTLVRIEIDGRTAARWVVTDAEGWRALAVATTPGSADVTVELTSAARGTWGHRGYEPQSEHAPCFELRALDEPAAGERGEEDPP